MLNNHQDRTERVVRVSRASVMIEGECPRNSAVYVVAATVEQRVRRVHEVGVVTV